MGQKPVRLATQKPDFLLAGQPEHDIETFQFLAHAKIKSVIRTFEAPGECWCFAPAIIFAQVSLRLPVLQHNFRFHIFLLIVLPLCSVSSSLHQTGFHHLRALIRTRREQVQRRRDPVTCSLSRRSACADRFFPARKPPTVPQSGCFPRPARKFPGQTAVPMRARAAPAAIH